MIAHITNQWIYIDNITAWEEELISKRFSVESPNLRYIDSSCQSWDGVYRKYNRKHRRLARPFLAELRLFAKENDLLLAVLDKREPTKYEAMPIDKITNDFLPGIVLKDFQIGAIKKLCNTECGVISITTGGGKCVVGESIVLLNGKEALIGDICSGLEEEEFARVEDHDMFVGGPNGCVRVMRIYKTNKRRVYNLTLSTGHVLCGVNEHRVYSTSGWKKLKDLNHGDQIQIYSKNCNEYGRYFIETMQKITTDKMQSDRVGQVLRDGFCPLDNWATVESLVECGLENCYDLQVDSKSHAYWTNGILSHNTEIMIAMCKVMNCPTVIIAEQLIVIDQIRKRLSLRDVCDEPGLFYAGKMPTGELIIIGSIQSLVVPKKPNKLIRDKYKDTESSTAEYKFKNAQKRYESSLKGYKSRNNKARALHKLIGKCEMILVDECVSEDTYISTDSGLIIAKELADRVEQGVAPKIVVGNSSYPIVAVSRSRRNAFCVTTSAGRQLIGSPNHPCATFVDGFRQDKHISTLCNDDLLLVRRYNIKDSNGMLDPTLYLNKWLGSGIKKRCLAFALGQKDLGSIRVKVSLDRLFTWQGILVNLSSITLDDYDSAKLLFGISYEKVGKHNGVPVTTTYNHIKAGRDVWRGLIEHIQQELSKPVLDNDLRGYELETVNTVKCVGHRNLVDFQVDGIESFEANGLLVHNCDLAVGKTYKNLFNYWFKGRRRYGFCLTGKTIINTTNGLSRLDDLVNKSIYVLSHDGSCDMFSSANVIYAGDREVVELSMSSGDKICGSANHLIADSIGNYIKFSDVSCGQRIKFSDDGLIYDFENLTKIFKILEVIPNFQNVTLQQFEFTQFDFNREFFEHNKIDYINHLTVDTSDNTRVLCSRKQFINIDQLATCNKTLQYSKKIVSGFKFGNVHDRKCSIDTIADVRYIENIYERFNCISHSENDGGTTSFYHRVLDSLDQLKNLHWMFNTASLNDDGVPFLCTVEHLTNTNFHFPLPHMFLVFRNKKPILYVVFFGDFLFVGFLCSIDLIFDINNFLDAFNTQVLVEIPNLVVCAINKAVISAFAIIMLNNKFGPSVIMPSSNNSSSSDISICFCKKVCNVINKKTKSSEPMYDIVDVKDNNNFYANNMLVHNSGTPYDEYKPVQRLVLNEHLGSVIYQQDRIQVEDTGLIVPLEYFMFAFGENGSINNASAYDIAMDDWLIYNDEFHNLIKSICNKYPDDGTLILVDRHDLGHALADIIPDSQFIYGNTPKKQRPEILRAFETRNKKVLIGGRNVRRGLDLDGGCENLIIATGGKLVSEFDQRLGRARRRNKRGKARVFDFLFLCNKYLYAHSRNRLKAAVGMGHETQVIFKGGVIDGKKFVKSRFRRPRFKTR